MLTAALASGCRFARDIPSLDHNLQMLKKKKPTPMSSLVVRKSRHSRFTLLALIVLALLVLVDHNLQRLQKPTPMSSLVERKSRYSRFLLYLLY
jgi:hypothetical protein